jgi:BON domain
VREDQRTDDEYLAAHLHEQLARDGRVHELELRLTVFDGHIVVEGVVPTAARQEAVRAVLEEACPDHVIDDRTSVAIYDPPDHEERIS